MAVFFFLNCANSFEKNVLRTVESGADGEESRVLNSISFSLFLSPQTCKKDIKHVHRIMYEYRYR